jgi:hypothetical protein
VTPVFRNQIKSFLKKALDLFRQITRSALRTRSDAGKPENSVQTVTILDALPQIGTELKPTKTHRALNRGQVLGGRFEIDDFLGAGGMGEVYKSFDLDLKEWVALKTLHAGAETDSTLILRLKKELQLARRITHPNICRLFEVGSDRLDDGRLIVFITMELLEGRVL